jgi:hypothetical protein
MKLTLVLSLKRGVFLILCEMVENIRKVVPDCEKRLQEMQFVLSTTGGKNTNTTWRTTCLRRGARHKAFHLSYNSFISSRTQIGPSAMFLAPLSAPRDAPTVVRAIPRHLRNPVRPRSIVIIFRLESSAIFSFYNLTLLFMSLYRFPFFQRCRIVPPTFHWPPLASLQSCFGFSAEFRWLISPHFLPTIQREFKKLDSSTLPVASHLLWAKVACVTDSVRIWCNSCVCYRFHTNLDITLACVTDSDITMVSQSGIDPYDCDDFRFEFRVTFISLPDNNHHSHTTKPFNVTIFS